MIRNFRDRATEAVAKGAHGKGFPADLLRRAQLLLNAIHLAATLDDLRSPPGNRLEALKGDRAGQYSVRINRQFRICFRWVDGHAEDVEITDYH